MDKWEKAHRSNTNKYARQIDAIYQEAVREAAAIGATIPNFSPDKPFSFSDYPSTQQRVQKLINSLKNGIQTVILNGVDSEWTLANNKNDELCNVVFGNNVKNLSTEQERRYYRSNGKACDAFKTRKIAGLGLSDRVWNYTNQFKTEIEMGLDLGLRDGLSAAEMSRDLRQYLKYPDKLFRRVRDEHGQLHLSKAAKAFNPGQGVYRSSYKNAMRLARTETNIAYRTSDYTRWQQLDFVVGIEIRTSNNHPIADICDELAGRYPKDFKFTGWHPQCRCHAVSILKTPEEMEADNERILNGEPINSSSQNEITDIPATYKTWVTDNSQRIKNAKSTPYFISDNKQYNRAVFEIDKPAPVITESKGNERFTFDAKKEKELIKNGWDIEYEFANRADYNKVMKDFDLVELEAETKSILEQYGIANDFRRKLHITKDNVQVVFKSQGNNFWIVRDFSKTKGKISVDHSLFTVPEELQGKGVSKQIFKAFYKQYNNIGVSGINVHANIDVGGYTWAKYGFCTSQSGAMSLISSRLQQNIISPAQFNDATNIVKQYFTSNNKASNFPMNLLADTEYGKKLLLGSDWNGCIDLLNETQRKTFEKYLFR
jgi:predicted GNAT family acetyltransferase